MIKRELVEIPEIVYHYTDAAGLLGIVSTGTLWMADIEFLNDAEELTYAREPFLGALRDTADRLGFRDRA